MQVIAVSCRVPLTSTYRIALPPIRVSGKYTAAFGHSFLPIVAVAAVAVVVFVVAAVSDSAVTDYCTRDESGHVCIIR